jgi:AraC-like DNA-binding protein
MCTRVGDGRHNVDRTSQFVASRSAFFDDLEVFARTEHSNSYPVHLHDRWQLTWILSGVVDFCHRDGSTLLRAGDAVLAAPNEPIGGRAHRGAPFGFATMQIPADILTRWPRDRVVARHGFAIRCRELIEKLVIARNGAEQTEALDEIAARFLGSALGNYELSGERGRRHPVVKRACDMLDGALSGKLPLPELAHAVRMNHRYVISVFKDGMGIPPHKYVMGRRIESARRMLNQGQALNAVAAEAGFNDQSHLTRDFKRAFGVTPGAYQAQQCHMNFLQNFPAAVA